MGSHQGKNRYRSQFLLGRFYLHINRFLDMLATLSLKFLNFIAFSLVAGIFQRGAILKVPGRRSPILSHPISVWCTPNAHDSIPLNVNYTQVAVSHLNRVPLSR